MMSHRTRRDWLQQGAALLAGSWLGAAHAQLPAGQDPQANAVWQGLRTAMFGQRTLTPATPNELVLEAPTRAVDAAVVPIALRSWLPQTPALYVQRLMLVIDGNPSPMGAVFQLTPEAGLADIETRVRIDTSSFVRAIAELSDGRLLMAVRFVKASGGCSAPALGDAAAAAASLGQMRLVAEGQPPAGLPQAVQLQIKHPNHTGLAMDPLTRQFTPAQFVREVVITLDGRPVLSGQVDFTLSENPHLRFHVLPGPGGELLARVTDTEGRQFSTRLQLPAPR